MSRSERIGRICNEGVIGDAIHFLFECPKLEDLKIEYYGDRMRKGRGTADALEANGKQEQLQVSLEEWNGLFTRHGLNR